jgi:predicted  nucleic acid-binding Zn-ribbon protein
MTPEAVLSFLVPVDWFQWTLLAVIVVSVMASIAFVHHYATPEEWARNWKSSEIGVRQQDLDSEHGSVLDISEAVASRAERMSDGLPGTLLIIGLLGTFVGLGIALNDAATAFASEGAPAEKLLGMLEGLGTKFKSSTWGILAFLVLKSWNAALDIDGRRMRWCAARMREQLDLRREAEASQETRLIEEIRASGQHGAEAISGAVSSSGDAVRQAIVAQVAVAGESKGILLEMARDVREQKTAMTGFLQASTENIAAIKASASQISASALQVGEAATQLSEVVRKLDVGIGRAISDMNAAIGSTLEAVSGQLMSASEGVGRSAAHLTVAVDGLERRITGLLDELKADLSNSIADMNQSFDRNMRNITTQLTGAAGEISDAVNALPKSVNETMTEIEAAISGTVGRMEGNFSTNLQKIDASLTGATSNIAAAVKDVPQAMSQVQASIADSVEIQNQTSQRFNATSKSLVQAVDQMRYFNESLGGDIKSGLRSISDAALQVGSLKDQFEAVTTSAGSSAASLQEVVPVLRALNDDLQTLQATIGKLSETVVHSGTTQNERIERHQGSIAGAMSRIADAISDLDAQLTRRSHVEVNALKEAKTIASDARGELATISRALMRLQAEIGAEGEGAETQAPST